MTIEEAREYWCRRLERAENYSDEHWDAEERHAHADYVDAMTHAITALAICREHEEAKPPKSNDEHTAAYWMQKTMDAAHEAYDRLKDTVDFKNAIAEAEAIKRRMGLTEQKKLTNADRIRQMTDEELAELVNSCVCNYTDKCLDNDCEECGRKWVKEEVSEDAAD